MLLTWRLTIRLKLNLPTIWSNHLLKICKKMLMHQQRNQLQLKKQKSQRPPKRKSLRKLRRKTLRRPTKRLQRRLKRKLLRRVRRLTTKSQWMPLLSKPIHPLLPMLPKILSHKLQSSTTKLCKWMMTRRLSRHLMFTTQTPWDPWSKTKYHQSRMPQSKLLRRKTNEHWMRRVNDLSCYLAL